MSYAKVMITMKKEIIATNKDTKDIKLTGMLFR